MKNAFKTKAILRIAGFIAIVAVMALSLASLSLTGCDNGPTGNPGNPGTGNPGGNPGTGGSTPGYFTLSGIPSTYNGKYAFILGFNESDSSATIIGFNWNGDTSAYAPDAMTPVRISGNTVSIPLIRSDLQGSANNYYSAYRGYGTAGLVVVYIGPNFTGIGSDGYNNWEAAWTCYEGVAFSNGGAAKNWSSGLHVPR